MLKLTSILALTGLALAGCSVTPLTDLKNRALELRVYGPDSDIVAVTLRYDGASGCPDVGEVRGTIAGAELHFDSASERPSRDTGSCSVYLSGPFTAGSGPVTVHLENDGAQLEAEFGSIHGDRMVALEAPADATLFAGDRVQLRWLHDEEQPLGIFITLENQLEILSFTDDQVTRLPDGALEFTVPPSSLVEGVPSLLRLGVQVYPHARRCDDFVACQAPFDPYVRPLGVTVSGLPRPM